MASLAPVIGLLFAAAITPGPNNLIVLEAGARRGMWAAASAMAGAVGGTLVLLALVWGGMDVAMKSVPALPVFLAILGALYLAWLGARLMFRTSTDEDGGTDAGGLPTSLLGVAGFQLLNPKAWLLVGTTTAAASGAVGIGMLAGLVAGIGLFCLSLWALAGAALSRALARPRTRRAFDRAMGLLLTFSALGVVIDALA